VKVWPVLSLLVQVLMLLQMMTIKTAKKCVLAVKNSKVQGMKF